MGFGTNKMRCLFKPTGIENDWKDFWGDEDEEEAELPQKILSSSSDASGGWQYCHQAKTNVFFRKTLRAPVPAGSLGDNSIKECQSHL